MSTTVSYKGSTIATATNQTKTLLTQGKYLEDDITVTDVSSGTSLGTKTITANGTYNASSDGYDGYSQVTSAVPASAVDQGMKVINSNGQHDVVGYAVAAVVVPNTYSAGDEGKVVSNGALASQTAHADVTPTTSDQTIDTTLNNSLKVKGDADLVAGNIKKDVEIFGVTGSYEGGGGGIDFDNYIKSSPSFPSGELVFNGTSLRDYAMAYARSLPEWQIYAPNCTYVGQNAFRECISLTSARLPAVTSMHGTGYVFYMGNTGTRKLALVDWGPANMPGNGFGFATVLKTLILRKTTIATLGNVNVLQYTPFANGGSGGTIYIPKVLYDHLGDGSSSDYKAASNWSTLDGYGTITWAQLEGSQYESPTWGH